VLLPGILLVHIRERHSADIANAEAFREARVVHMSFHRLIVLAFLTFLCGCDWARKVIRVRPVQRGLRAKRVCRAYKDQLVQPDHQDRRVSRARQARRSELFALIV
jgi:hypothetical protein